MKRCALAMLMMACAHGPKQVSAPDAGSPEVLGSSFDTVLTFDDLVAPSEVEHYKIFGPNWREEVVAGELYRRMLEDSQRAYADEHKITVEPAELAACLKGLTADGIPRPKEESEKRARKIVFRWKVSRALYAEFGGRLLQDVIGLTPVDAQTKLLQHYEANKSLRIDRADLRKELFSPDLTKAVDVAGTAQESEWAQPPRCGANANGPSANVPGGEPRVKVATAFGSDVYLDQLVSAAELAKQEKWSGAGPVPDGLATRVGDALLSLLLNGAREAYAKDHGLMPTAAEYQRCIDGFTRTGMYSPKLPESLKMVTEQMARGMVLSFKVDNAIFKAFGGRLVFQQSGLEPVDAHRKLLEEYEAKTSFTFARPELRAATYHYFTLRFTELKDDKSLALFSAKPICETYEADGR